MNKLISIFNKIFRYRIVTAYFMLGQIVVYITIFGALQIYNYAMNKEEDRKSTIYNQRITVDLTTSSENPDILVNAGNGIDKGNILLSGRMSVYYKEESTSSRAEIIIASNEKLSYKMVSGHMPGTEESDYGKNVVALGREKYHKAFERDGKRYVTFCGEEYEVVGVIGSNSDYWDYKIVFNINCMGQNTLEEIMKDRSFELHLDSNVESAEAIKESYDKMFINIKNVDSYANISASVDRSSGESTIGRTYTLQNMKVNVIVYIFCVVNSILVSYFWILQRRKEIAVRKAFGYSNMRIMCMLFGQMLLMMLISLIVFLMLYAVTYVWVKNVLYIYINLSTLMGVAGILVFTSLISVLYPAYKVLKINSAQGVVMK